LLQIYQPIVYYTISITENGKLETSNFKLSQTDKTPEINNKLTVH